MGDLFQRPLIEPERGFRMDGGSDQSIWYTQQVIAWQTRLYAFILSLTGDPNAADDVLQNANVAILRKQKSFRLDAKFGAGPCRSPITRSNAIGIPPLGPGRFDNRLLDQLVAKMAELGDEPGLELVFLRECMSRLSAHEADAWSSLRRRLGAGDRREVRTARGLRLADPLSDPLQAGGVHQDGPQRGASR